MTTPTPGLDQLQELLRDLQRRLRALETGAGARPAATALSVAPFPYSAGDATRWAGFSSLDYRPFWVWWARMEWTALDVAVRGTTSGDRAGQWRLTCDGTSLFEADAQPGSTADVLTERVVDLRPVLTQDAGTPGSLRRFTLDGRVVGGTAGAFYTVPERLVLTGARFE